MSDWKQAEKTAQSVLKLVDANVEEDAVVSVPESAGDESEMCGGSGEAAGCLDTQKKKTSESCEPMDTTPKTFESEEVPVGEVVECSQTPELSEEVSAAEVPAVSVPPVPGFAVPSGAVSLGVVSSGAVPPDLGERYQVLSLLGEGGMGTVWKVFDRDLQETFAVKVLRPEFVADETLTKRFEKEAKLACELTHANIAAIFGPCFDKQGHPGIIMRYVDGESLAELLAREGKLSVERTTFILRQLCDALAHSHMKGIVHRDIKPSNIIIAKTEDGSDLVQLVDFGIAQSVYTKATATQALTRSVDVLGSPSYMSPEQFLGKEITAKSDIYSLGCVVYEMLTGAPPFVDENPVRLVLKHLNEAPDLLKVPDSMRSVVSNCLEKETVARPGRVDKVIEMIDVNMPGNYGCESYLPFAIVVVAFAVISTFDSGFDFAFYGLFLSLCAVSLCGLNSRNAGQSSVYRKLEFVFLSSSMVTALYGLWFILCPPPWRGLKDIIFPPLVLLVNSVPIFFSLYERGKSWFLVNCSKSFSGGSLLWGYRIFEGIVITLTSFCLFGFGCVSILFFRELIFLWDFGLVFHLANLVAASPAVILLCLLYVLRASLDIVRFGSISWSNTISYIRLSCVSFALGLMSASIIGLGFWQPGMEKLLRQVSVGDYGVTLAQKEGLQVEALKYPLGGLFNIARLASMQPLESLDKVALKRNLELLNQIVNDKAETDKSTLARTYWWRYYVRGTMGVKWRERKGDWDLALNNIQAALAGRAPAQSPSLDGSLAQAFRNAGRPILGPLDYWLEYPRYRLADDTYRLADSAEANGDFVRAKKALAITKGYVSADDDYLRTNIDYLEERILKHDGEH